MSVSEYDLSELQAEVIAIQAVLMGVFRRLARDRPDLTPLFCKAFDEAEIILAGVANRSGLEEAIGTTTGALRIIEQLRMAVVGDESRCL